MRPALGRSRCLRSFRALVARGSLALKSKEGRRRVFSARSAIVEAPAAGCVAFGLRSLAQGRRVLVRVEPGRR
jgi:hypothetical protein